MFTPALQTIQAHADAAGQIDRLVQIDSTIVRAHQHAAIGREKRGGQRSKEPDDHALGRLRPGPTANVHPVYDGKDRPLAILLTPASTTTVSAHIGHFFRSGFPAAARSGPAAGPTRSSQTAGLSP
ncbi:hypothetical protein GCM10011578_050520 [Streptomyces fuscichromogenes]|uniref:Transposase n=1 Tax=Streptomyces fuscichromogenes TaxID=1324013 RepID=A0A918CT50_9ACTN|nr:hypothetical protein GCM10011578_050520 [Streptomyces fuscichromogenes]